MKFAFSLLACLVSARRVYVYLEDWSTPSASAVVQHYHDLINAGATDLLNCFIIPDCPCGVQDFAESVSDWMNLSQDQRNEVLSALHAKNGYLYAVTGGGSYGLTYASKDPVQYADYVCGHAAQYNYDGVDFDLESLPAGFGPDSQYMQWAVSATKQCRTHVNRITHAPQSPYLGSWGNYGYGAVLPYVDKLLVQYYNQNDEQNTYSGTFVTDSFGAGVEQVIAKFPEYKDKFVVGKYIYTNYGSRGMMDAKTLAGYLKQFETETGYDNGVMVWRSPQASEGLRPQWLSSDLPALSAGGAPSVQTNAPIAQPTTTTTRPVPAPITQAPQPATQAPQPITQAPQPITQAPQPITQAPQPATKAPASGDMVTDCQNAVGNPLIEDWNTNCKAQCSYYAHDGAAFCPGVTDGVALATCVTKMWASCQLI